MNEFKKKIKFHKVNQWFQFDSSNLRSAKSIEFAKCTCVQLELVNCLKFFFSFI